MVRIWLNLFPAYAAILLLMFVHSNITCAQNAPPSPERQWLGPGEQEIKRDAERFRDSNPSIDRAKIYSLVELIAFAQSHNPETRFAWERARAQAAALGVGRIDAAKAELLAANFAFNDTHRNIIFRVEKAYYELLNTSGQVIAARTSLTNAQTAQQAAEDRLKQGLATLPDVLEARSATAQAEFDLQSVIGAKDVAAGDLATALGVSPTSVIQVQSIDDLPIPLSLGDNVEAAIDREFELRPDLLQQVAEIRAANGRVKEARAAYYPSLKLSFGPGAQKQFGVQQLFPRTHRDGFTGELAFSLKWNLFDGGARKNRLANERANLRAAEAQLNVTRDQIANETWAAYSNAKTAFQQRQAARALLEAASQSYASALEAYKYGVRSFLDVTAAQRTLADAQAADVFARARVLTALAELAFRIGGTRP